VICVPDGDVECPKAKAEEACKTTCAAVHRTAPCSCRRAFPRRSISRSTVMSVQTWRDYEGCAQRIAKKGEGDCIGQYFAFWKCIDACVRLPARSVTGVRELAGSMGCHFCNSAGQATVLAEAQVGALGARFRL
jgi:hypothetical protein